ncbi:MAG: MlaD family protein [Gemmataceae bacterium]
MTERNLRLRLGLFVLVAAFLFGTMIVMFGSLPGFFRPSSTYYVRFTDAPGLAPGAPVRRSGVRIGEVREIQLDEEKGIVRVQLAIRSPYSIRKNEQPTLMTGLLGSDASIDFIPRQIEDGEPIDREPYESGAEVVGVRAATVGSLLKGASEVVPSTQETLGEIRKSIQRLEKLATRVEKSIPLAEDTLRSYRDLARRAERSIPDLEKTNTQMQELIRSAREVVPEAQRTVEAYRDLAKTAQNSMPELLKTNKELQDLARGLTNALPTIERTSEEITDLASDVRKTLPTVRNVVEDFGGAARTATKLLEEADVFWQNNRDAVTASLQNLNRTMQQVSRMFSDENINKVNSTLTNINTASNSFPHLTQNATDISDQGRITVRRLNDSLAKIDKPLDDLQKAMADFSRVSKDVSRFLEGAQKVIDDAQRVSKPLAERADAITRNVDESLCKINETLSDVRGLMRTIDRSDGLLKKLITDPSLYNNIDAAAVMVVKMVPRLDHILKDFEIFADKLARHPESIGLGGVVRPGSGLKNPPSPPLNSKPQILTPTAVPGMPVPGIPVPSFSPNR